MSQGAGWILGSLALAGVAVGAAVMVAKENDGGSPPRKNPASEDNSYGAGYFPLPNKLLYVGNFVENLRPNARVEHKVFPARGRVPEEHMLTARVRGLSVTRKDMETLLMLGLSRIQSNEPGTVSFYFTA